MRRSAKRSAAWNKARQLRGHSDPQSDVSPLSETKSVPLPRCSPPQPREHSDPQSDDPDTEPRASASCAPPPKPYGRRAAPPESNSRQTCPAGNSAHRYKPAAKTSFASAKSSASTQTIVQAASRTTPFSVTTKRQIPPRPAAQSQPRLRHGKITRSSRRHLIPQVRPGSNGPCAIIASRPQHPASFTHRPNGALPTGPGKNVK